MATRQYKHAGEMPRHYRRALRLLAHGQPYAHAALTCDVSQATLYALVKTPAGRDYLARHRDRVDAHRVLLAATLPWLTLARAVGEGKKVRGPSPAQVEAEADAAGE